jgi:hypothetical protein
MSTYAKRASGLGKAANRAKAQDRAKLIAPAIEQAQAEDHTSLCQIAAYLNAQPITTPRGRHWTATAVANAQRLIAAAQSR